MSQPFLTPLHNDFQWKNLYMKQYGVCTYAPPMPPNPSTTTGAFPKRKDIQAFFGDLDDNGEEDYTTVETVHRKALSRKETFFSIADNFCDEGAVAGAGSSQTSAPALPGESSAEAFIKHAHSGEDGAPDDTLDDDLFSANFFDFLKTKRRALSNGEIDVSGGATLGSMLNSGNLHSEGLPSSSVNVQTYMQLVNPHRLPPEIYRLQVDAWALLMDSRGMAWLEREAGEKGRSATSIRRRLLEVTSGTSSLRKTWEGLAAEKRRGLGSDASTATVLTEEQSSQSVYESFTPFFAVISSPSIVRRLRDQFMASRRAQARGLDGTAADTVGLPLFSQFATWRECYESRKTWSRTPFSFLLVHDASYNFAQISALYMLLRVIERYTHVHSNICLECRSSPIDLESAGAMLAQARTARRHAEMERHLCPLFAVQQITEDVLVIFEQSSSRTTMNMMMQVCAFLTDTVLDPETASRFFSAESLQRQSALASPGSGCVPQSSTNSRNPSRVGSDDDGGDTNEDNGGTAQSSQLEAHQKQRLDLLALKRFSDSEFESLFQLSHWFIDAATANSRVPVDPALLPAIPRFTGHPEMALQAPSQVMLNAADTYSNVSYTPKSSRQLSPSKSRIGGGARSVRSVRSLRRQSPAKSAASSEYMSLPPVAADGSTRTPAPPRPLEHSYIPGRVQQHMPVGSLLEAIALYEVRGAQGLPGKQREDSAALGLFFKLERFGSSTRDQSPLHEPAQPALLPPLPPSVSSQQGGGGAREEVFSPATTLLATPLIFLLTYIRLHGAPWLKHLFDRLFNILRRESVLLYVNRLDLEESSVSSAGGGTTSSIPASFGSRSFSLSRDLNSSKRMGTSLSLGNPPYNNLSQQQQQQQQLLPPRLTADEVVSFLHRMERLEDLVCQDIQYVMNEFFSALHGKRSATRLPQGITTLVTQFTSMIHLHLLSSVVHRQGENLSRPDVATSKVQEYLMFLKQKRMAGKAFCTEQVSDVAVSRLMSNIGRHRLAKFILFDSWILPALNNAVTCGYLSESSSMHLRWNIDAFARYLKILVNSPFSESGKVSGKHVSTGVKPVRVRPAAAPTATAAGVAKRRKPNKDSTAPPFKLTLPPYITGIYDVSSGCLVRVFGPALTLIQEEAGALATVQQDQLMTTMLATSRTMGSQQHSIELHTATLQATSAQHTVPGTSSTAATASSALLAKGAYFVSMDEGSWDDISDSLHTLNEMIGVVGYDPDEDTDLFHIDSASAPFDGHCAMRVLDMFCRRSSCETSTNVVVSEFEVAPSMAAGCVNKLFNVMTGRHPLIEHAISTHVLPSKFSFSPYLHCLTGVLLHPKTAARALDNVYYNSRRFYNTLMRPVEDESLLHLLSALVMDKDDLPMVDSNSLIPLVSSMPGTLRNGRKAAAERGAKRQKVSLAERYEQEARKLKHHHLFLATGAQPSPRGVQHLLDNVGPNNPARILQAGRELIERETMVVPTCFDPWWRAMTTALCVKAVTVFSECSPQHSDAFLQWCQSKGEQARRENKALIDLYVQQRGKELCTAPEAMGGGRGARRSTDGAGGKRRKNNPGVSTRCSMVTNGSSSGNPRVLPTRRKKKRRQKSKPRRAAK